MATTLEIETKINTKDAVTAIGKLEDRIKNLEKIQENAVEQQKDMAKAVKATEKNTGGLAKGFKGVGLAIKAAGIGLLIGVLGTVVDLFKQNQKVADLFTTSFNALSKVVNDFIDFITGSGLTSVQEFFTDLIDNPMENIKALGQAILDNIIERFRSAIEVFGFAGQAIKKLFQGDWDGAMEAAKEAGKELVDVYTGVDNTTEKVSEAFDKASEAVTKYAKETWDAAAAATELNNQSQLAEARQQLLIEKYDREAEIQREIRDNINKTFEERLAAANKLGEILDQQRDAELELVNIKLQEAEANVAISNSTENQVALLQAQAAGEEVLARITGFRTEQQEQLRALEKEIADEKQAAIDAEIDATFKALEAEKKAEEERTKKAKEESDERAKIEEEAQKTKLATINQGFQILSDLSQGNLAAQKATAVAQATFDTYAAIAGTLNSVSRTSAGAIPGYAIAQAVATGIFGLLQVRKILSTPTEGGASPSIGGGGASASTPPENQNTLPDFGFVNQGVGGTQGADFGASRSYVVLQDIRDKESLDERIRDSSRLG